MENKSVAQVPVERVSPQQVVVFEDNLAVEEPLEMRVHYISEGRQTQRTLSVTMRTPGNDEELAAGFFFTEGIIQSRDQIDKVAHLAYDDNIINLHLKEHAIPRLQQSDRNFYTTSSCGVCGKSSIDAIKTVSIYKQEEDSLRIAANKLYSLQDKLRREQAVFASTGGLHASALFDMEANFLLLREDVGRHNALDKVIGAALMNGQLPLNNSILLLSGRASFELIQKATMAGIKIVVAVGAPSSLAVQLATECGITLIGFLRNDRFNIYSHSQRITILAQQSV